MSNTDKQSVGIRNAVKSRLEKQKNHQDNA